MSKPTRLVHLITSLDLGGAQSVLLRLVTHLNVARFQSVVISMTNLGLVGAQLQARGIPAYTLGMRRGVPSPVGLIKLVSLLRRERPFLLQTWLYHADLLGTLASQVARQPHLIWNVRSSNMDMKRYNLLSGWTIKACILLSGVPQVVVVNSNAGLKFHQQLGYHPRQWQVSPNGIDLDEFRPDPALRAELRAELGLESTTVLIGMVARFDPEKDHETFLRAAGQLAQSDANARFLLAGEGLTHANPTLSGLIREQQLESRMRLLGPCTNLPRVYAALDIATLSSAFGEGFSNVVAEAMACSLPNVVTNVGDAAYIVGDTGLVVPPQNPAALAEGWQSLIAIGAEGRQRLGRAARIRIQDHYSLPRMIQEYERLYDSLIDD